MYISKLQVALYNVYSTVCNDMYHVFGNDRKNFDLNPVLSTYLIFPGKLKQVHVQYYYLSTLLKA